MGTTFLSRKNLQATALPTHAVYSCAMQPSIEAHVPATTKRWNSIDARFGFQGSEEGG